MRALWLLATALLTPVHPAVRPDTDDYPRRVVAPLGGREEVLVVHRFEKSDTKLIRKTIQL